MGVMLLRRSGIGFGALNSPSKSKLASLVMLSGFIIDGSVAGRCVSSKSRIVGSCGRVCTVTGGLGRGGGVATACTGGGGRDGLAGCGFTEALVTKIEQNELCVFK